MSKKTKNKTKTTIMFYKDNQAYDWLFDWLCKSLESPLISLYFAKKMDAAIY